MKNYLDNHMKIPFCLPLINKDVEKDVLNCLNETGWLTTGPKVKELEDEITKLCQTRSTICVNSWTSGMLLLIRFRLKKEGCLRKLIE